MERAFGGPDAIAIKLNDRAYEEAHSNRSAKIVGEWLRANGAQEDLADGVEALIRVHEWGGSPDANLVQAADSLSFLETNIDLMLGFARTGKYPKAEVALKIDAMYERIQLPAARELARPMWEQAKLRLMGSDPRVGTGVRPLISASRITRRAALPSARARARRATPCRRHRSSGAREKRPRMALGHRRCETGRGAAR